MSDYHNIVLILPSVISNSCTAVNLHTTRVIMIGHVGCCSRRDWSFPIGDYSWPVTPVTCRHCVFASIVVVTVPAFEAFCLRFYEATQSRPVAQVAFSSLRNLLPENAAKRGKTLALCQQLVARRRHGGIMTDKHQTQDIGAYDSQYFTRTLTFILPCSSEIFLSKFLSPSAPQ